MTSTIYFCQEGFNLEKEIKPSILTLVSDSSCKNPLTLHSVSSEDIIRHINVWGLDQLLVMTKYLIFFWSNRQCCTGCGLHLNNVGKEKLNGMISEIIKKTISTKFNSNIFCGSLNINVPHCNISDISIFIDLRILMLTLMSLWGVYILMILIIL